MAKRYLRRFWVCVTCAAAVVLLSVTASAQELPKLTLAGGYATLHDYDTARNFPTGWFASLGGNVNDWFGIAAEGFGNYKTVDVLGSSVNLNVHSFMAGPKVTLRRDHMALFGQALFGVARSASGGNSRFPAASETDFAIQPGGGIDVSVAGNLGVRLGVNYQLIQSPNCCLSHIGTVAKELQFVAGVVYPSPTMRH